MKALLSFFLATAACFAASSLPSAILPESQRIDEILARDWEKHKLQPNPPVSDEVLVRRLYLDIAGRIPTVEETQEFVQSRDEMKRMKLIDRLLASDGYASNMFNYWADILRLTDDVNGKVAARAYAEFVKRSLKENKPYDRFVRELLTAEGGVWDSNAIGFYTRDENKLDHLAYATQVFLGTSIICAECHNHPFDKWTEKDFYGLAAFTYGMGGTGRKSSGDPFGLSQAMKSGTKLLDKNELRKLSREEQAKYLQDHAAEIEKHNQDMDMLQRTLNSLSKDLLFTTITMTDRLPDLPDDYKYPDARPGDTIGPKVIFGHEAAVSKDGSRLEAFANWVASPENPRFTTVIANRMWKKVFGLGLIEPVDEITDSTVPSNSELMDCLTQIMIAKGYSLKSFLRVLYNTAAYQRAATTAEVVAGDPYHFTGPLLRRMSAEQVWDSMVTLTHGNLDHVVSEDNERLHRYLDGLKLLVDTVHSKGVDGMMDIARRSPDSRGGGPQKKVKLPPDEGAKMQKTPGSGGDDALTLLLGEERARDLRQDSNPKKPSGKGAPVIDKKAFAGMSQSARQAAIEMAANVTLSTRASELPSPTRPGHLLRIFGQSDRDQISNANDEASVGQALALLNSPLTEILGKPDAALQQGLARLPSPSEKIDFLYLSLLCRHPDRSEKAVLDQVLHERGEKAVPDVLHALLTGAQFLFVQ